MGGYSSEAEISLKSGDVVYNSLDANKYALYKVYIFKDRWFVKLETSDKKVRKYA